jgi:hypothetical protein
VPFRTIRTEIMKITKKVEEKKMMILKMINTDVIRVGAKKIKTIFTMIKTMKIIVTVMIIIMTTHLSRGAELWKYC